MIPSEIHCNKIHFVSKLHSNYSLPRNIVQQITAFLEKIEELRYSRGVSKEQLLKSANEIFTDSALYWFRSVRPTISTWDDLVRKLRDVLTIRL